jgi:uncharacterized membrane protein YobD (UPF0266 family)
MMSESYEQEMLAAMTAVQVELRRANRINALILTELEHIRCARNDVNIHETALAGSRLTKMVIAMVYEVLPTARTEGIPTG